MNIRDFLKTAELPPKWLSAKTGYTGAFVRCIVRGARNPSPKAFARFQWAARGALDPDACGVDPEKANAHLPDLSLLPDPYLPGVTWNNDCVPVIERLRKEAIAHSEGANP